MVTFQLAGVASGACDPDCRFRDGRVGPRSPACLPRTTDSNAGDAVVKSLPSARANVRRIEVSVDFSPHQWDAAEFSTGPHFSPRLRTSLTNNSDRTTVQEFTPNAVFADDFEPSRVIHIG